MQAQDKIKKLFGPYNAEVEEEIKRLLTEQPDFLMYDMMRYFFGFLDEGLKPVEIYGGKRFRPGLCLMIAEMYGHRSEALEAATAIEIFHNFTLIHDDIEDNDCLRRGRPTVWKLWGVNHGINTGDGQLMLVNLELAKMAQRNLESFPIILEFLNKKFLEVIEGQFLDFTLAELPLNDEFVTENNYLMMIQKKTSVLVGAAASVAGIIARVGREEQEVLWRFGLNLGLAFQVQDDLISIWSNAEQTGKIEVNDLYEKKKTLPILRLYDRLQGDEKKKLLEIYQQSNRLSEAEVGEIINWLNREDAYDYTKTKMNSYIDKAKEAITGLLVKEQDRIKLLEVVEALLSNMN